MAESIREPVYVATSQTSRKILPQLMIWRGRTYQFVQLGLHHVTYDGDVLLHIFSVATACACFEISLNTKTLLWTLDKMEAL